MSEPPPSGGPLRRDVMHAVLAPGHVLPRQDPLVREQLLEVPQGRHRIDPPLDDEAFPESFLFSLRLALVRAIEVRHLVPDDGWPRVRDARPNAAHVALAQLEAAGRLARLVKQNVDGLHQRAGSRRALDLHGRLDVVECLDCGAFVPRDDLAAERLGLPVAAVNRGRTRADDRLHLKVEADCASALAEVAAAAGC